MRHRATTLLRSTSLGNEEAKHSSNMSLSYLSEIVYSIRQVFHDESDTSALISQLEYQQ